MWRTLYLCCHITLENKKSLEDMQSFLVSPSLGVGPMYKRETVLSSKCEAVFVAYGQYPNDGKVLQTNGIGCEIRIV